MAIGKAGLVVVAAMHLPCFTSFPYANSPLGISSAFAAENFYYNDDDIKFHFSREKDLVHLNHLVGMLSDLSREQDKLFRSKAGTGENTAFVKAQEFINNANMFASENKYEDAFGELEGAYRGILKSLEELGAKRAEKRTEFFKAPKK